MNNSTRSGFTLIELLIVVTIIALIGVASISWFSHMMEVQDADTAMKTIDNTLAALDRSVQRHDMTSYETVFASGSLGFVTNADWYKKTAPTEYSFDFASGTGAAKSTDTSTGVWELHFAAYDTSGEAFVLTANGGIKTFSFPVGIQKRRYEISGAIGNRTMNSYAMQYYNLTNLHGNSESEIRLVGIVGWNNVSYTSLTVRNVLGKKVLQGSGASIDTLEKATLSFDKNGKEMTMILMP